VRIVGIVLVIIGALALAFPSFAFTTYEPVADAGSVQVTAKKEKTVWVPPVASGIAVVSGLILVASTTREDQV
jgi:hypothetical protein